MKYLLSSFVVGFKEGDKRFNDYQVGTFLRSIVLIAVEMAHNRVGILQELFMHHMGGTDGKYIINYYICNKNNILYTDRLTVNYNYYTVSKC